MKEISFSHVFRNLKISFFYFLLGCFFGIIFGFSIFFISKSMYQKIINLFIKRITFGIQYIGSYKLWFILNNLVVLLLIIASFLLIMSMILRKRKIRIFKKFERMEKKKPKVILFSLYMIPIGTLIINGFLVTLLLVYMLLSYGFEKFGIIFLLLLPHGINEILALFFSSSLALACLKVLKPYILRKKWEEAKKIAKNLLLSKTTIIFIVFIVLLIIFSGFIEGSIATLIQR